MEQPSSRTFDHPPGVLDYGCPQGQVPGFIRSRFTPVVALVLLNYALFYAGMRLDAFGGTIDALGAFLCRTTWAAGGLLIPVGITYSFVRRFLLPARRWDLYGAGLAIVLHLVVCTDLSRQPWYLPGR